MMQGNGTSATSAARYAFDLLKKDKDKHNLSQEERDAALSQLKILGRTPANVKNLYEDDGVLVIGYYGFGTFPRTTAREALRCLANALLLFPDTQKKLAALDLQLKASDDLHLQNDEDEFILSRILFLMTYSKAIDFGGLIDSHDLAINIKSHIHRHAGSQSQSDTAWAALGETLKLLYNVCNAAPDRMNAFSATIPDLLQLLTDIKLTSPALQPPVTYVLNALAGIEMSQSDNTQVVAEAITSRLSPAVEKLIQILDECTKDYKPSELDTQAIPLVTILRKVNEGAGANTRGIMKTRLLPNDSERDLPLGQSSTIASRLLRLTTASGMSLLPEAVSSLLFELSDKCAEMFVKNIGYGYAAGYLMTHKIPIPESATKSAVGGAQIPVNPVTGQKLDKESKPDVPEMSSEEKEREAERLFVLFQRLKATGVIDAENPVRKAMEEGRFEEVDDSESDNE